MKERCWLRWSLWGAAATVGILLLVLAGLWLWLRSALPAHDGEIVLAGLAQPVEVRFDAAGVPTIYAGDERDAAFALGYLHAGDRLFQMEFQRRLASGRLSEVVGPATIETDRMMRLFGFASLLGALALVGASYLPFTIGRGSFGHFARASRSRMSAGEVPWMLGSRERLEMAYLKWL